MEYKDQIQEMKNRKHLLRLQEEDTNEEVMELLKELEKAKEKELRAEIDKEEIKQAIKDMDHSALSHADRQKKRELEKLSSERENLRIREQQMIDEVKRMEQDMINKEKKFREEADEARKVNNDDIFAINEIKKKELEMAKQRGDTVVKLQHKRQMLEKERNRIMKDLDHVTHGYGGDTRPKSSLSSAGEDIMRNTRDFDRADIDPAMKDKIIADQVKINHLREQQQKTNHQMMNFDELDMLEEDVNNKIRRDYPRTAKIPNNEPAAPMSFPQSEVKMPNEMKTQLPPKAKDSENIADGLADLNKSYVNNGGDDPNFIKKVNDLNDFIKNRAPQKVKEGLGYEENSAKIADHPMPLAAPPAPGMVPPYGAPPYGVPPYGAPPYGAPPYGAPPYGGHPYGHPPAYANNPNLMYMDSMVKQIQDENKKLEEELEKINNDDYDFENLAQNAAGEVEALKNQLLPGGVPEEEPFPENFIFRQNDFRSEDLEVEERALMNIAAQEYDHLRLLSRLPVNSELYRVKMDQYKELSTMRAEVEKVLQEQRLEKIRRDYEKQKYEDERKYNHERWMEEQKREILAAKLRRNAEGGDTGYQPPGDQTMTYPGADFNAPDTQNYMNTANQPPPTGQFPPKTAMPNTAAAPEEEKIYDPKVGFLVFFDSVARIPREHNGMQIVYGCYNNGRGLTDNRVVSYQDKEADPEAPEMNRVVYDVGNQVKHISPHPSANMVIECQVPDKSVKSGPNKFKAFGWTVLNLFDYTYDFHTGEFRLPLYTGETLSDIDARDINTLQPLQDTFICMRLAVPGDNIATSQYLPEKDTNEYRIPSIHQVEHVHQPFKPNPDFGDDYGQNYDQPDTYQPAPQPRAGGNDQAMIPMRQPNRKIPTEKDPFYRCNGANVFIHYVKQFPSQNSIKVGATILEEDKVVRIGHDQRECNWASYPIDAGKVLMAKWKNTAQVQPDGAPIIDRTKDEEDQYMVGHRKIGYNKDSEDILVPINSEVSWEHDFYKMIWDKNLRNELFLVITLMEASVGLNKRVHPSSHEYVAVGYGSIKLNHPDGTLRYGTFDIPLYHPPPKIRNHDPDKLMRSSIKITVSQPLPSMPQMEPYKDKPLKPVPGAPAQMPKDMPMLNPPPNRPPEDAPFIPNDREQYSPDKFDKKDGIDIYIDTGRFFPENASYSRIVMHCITIKGKQVLRPEVIQPDIVASTSREPFYGNRSEIRVSKMDPTSIIVLTIDTFDLSKGHTVIVGHACMPLFIDNTTRSPCINPRCTDYGLLDGDYQIPIQMQFVKNLKNSTYKDFQDCEKIPAASLLIRIRKAAKDAKGRPLTFGAKISIEEAKNKGIIDPPKPYSDGDYNTSFCKVSATESVIMEAKLKRPSPNTRDVLTALINQHSKEEKKLSDTEIKAYVEKNFMVPPIKSFSDLGRISYLDKKFFSEYIPQLGFTSSVDFLLHSNPKSLYYIVCSLAPPGRLYMNDRRTLGLEDTHAATDVQTTYKIDFESPQKAITFSDSKHNFYVTQPNATSVLVYEIFEVKLSKTGIKKVENYGFSILPIFEFLETTGNGENLEIYLNTDIHQLMIFKGKPTAEFLEDMTSRDNFTSTLGNKISNREITPLPKSTLIVKLHDNQFEKIFTNAEASYNILNQNYMLVKNPKNLKFTYKKDYLTNKSNKLIKILGKNYSMADYETQVYEYISL
ncbi:unnamed protein product [Moneuplotes crassus]|uniref:Uncharacterized protein n=1 Tax=Euplotes crassus TaxID=5936 RepID=A0AAD2D7Z8_EUPCR|nr:unnamed protein product [Moneuplotes crassus]